MDGYAVLVKNACKNYGSREVLKNLNMKVPRGCIYGLLGASGCGKTTLLGCIVGRKRLDSGEVYTLGGKPGTKGSGVPGPRVGYMPQDIALVAEFTVRDAVYYFGRILEMEDGVIEERFQDLKKLLDLPPDNRYLKNCSGGQQRRVSFACAMIHKPELLILDEPTVGLDPVLRDSIWQYLVEITEKEQIAVIITTHYIEETKQAHRIGLMREGRLLAEESPENLLAIFGTDTLEEVFLILSRQQEEGRLKDDVADDQNNSVLHGRVYSEMSIVESAQGSTDVLTRKSKKYRTTTNDLSLNSKRIKSLLAKNSKQFFRNAGGMAFTFIFPILEMLSFLLAVGADVKNIPLAVVNEESIMAHCGNYTKFGTTRPYSFTNCEFHDLGCRFLNETEDPMFNLIYYDDLDKAIQDIKHGDLVGVMHMSSNFSESFEFRLNDGRDMSDEAVNSSQIKVWLDMSNRQIGESVKFRLIQKYIDFQVAAFEDCKLLPKLGEIPLRFNYEYGDRDDTYTIFMTPGVLLTAVFFLGTTLTSTIIITDRLEGVWDRSIVAGVSSLEIMLTHFAVQFVLVFFQTVEVILITFVFFKMEYVGSMGTIFVFVLMQGLAGMVLGFLISVVSDSHSAANICSTGFFYPMIVLCGTVWPLEAQSAGLRFFSQLMPFTLPTISLRNIMKKGYGLDSIEVWSGFSVTLAWVVGLSVVSVMGIKRRR